MEKSSELGDIHHSVIYSAAHALQGLTSGGELYGSKILAAVWEK